MLQIAREKKAASNQLRVIPTEIPTALERIIAKIIKEIYEFLTNL